MYEYDEDSHSCLSCIASPVLHSALSIDNSRRCRHESGIKTRSEQPHCSQDILSLLAIEMHAVLHGMNDSYVPLKCDRHQIVCG